MIRSLTACSLLLLVAAAPAPTEIGRIKRTYGEARVLRGGTVLPAASGLTLAEHDKLVTGATGRITIAFIDNTRFSVGPKSNISIDAFKFDETTHQGGRFVTKVDRGSLAVVSGQIAHEDKDAMRVRTPTSLLGVRGTRFVVDVK